MTSHIASYIEYLAPTYNILVLLSYTNFTKNSAPLACFNTISWHFDSGLFFPGHPVNAISIKTYNKQFTNLCLHCCIHHPTTADSIHDITAWLHLKMPTWLQDSIGIWLPKTQQAACEAHSEKSNSMSAHNTTLQCQSNVEVQPEAVSSGTTSVKTIYVVDFQWVRDCRHGILNRHCRLSVDEMCHQLTHFHISTRFAQWPLTQNDISLPKSVRLGEWVVA